MFGDTIAAIGSALGAAGIGVVRISGPEAWQVVDRIFIPADRGRWEKKGSYRVYFGWIKAAREDVIIDEVLVTFMKGPKTFTREDVVEIGCHGGSLVVRRVLEEVLRAGARLARPGEFTQRAFMNGRIDLSQAEAVLDIVRARTDKALSVAWGQLEGKLSREVRRLRKNIVEMLGRIQAGIDFPEEVGDPDVEELLGKLRETREGVKQLLAGAERGRIYSEGVICALCGRPNVGKSTLFNRLLREERAIVTDIPGTTRDVLEGWVNLEGIPVRLLDTAGRRDTADRVEMAGVERAVRAVEDADVVLVVLDAGEGVTEDDVRLLAEARAKKAVVVVNKIDVCPEGGRGERLKEVAPGLPVVWVSAKEGWGMEELEEKLAEVILGEECQLAEVEILVSKVRHKEALERAEGYLEDAEEAIKGGIPLDVVGVDLAAAGDALGEITGESVSEDVLEVIFGEFCVGK